VRQYSVGDYIATFIGFIGLAVPSFMLALVLMYVGFKFFNMNVGGLFSPDFAEAPWSWSKRNCASAARGRRSSARRTSCPR
jgi:peptide/nickel transport system permease protein